MSDEHPIPASKEYDRQVTELWFSIREFVEADMLRNLDQTTAVQLCSRTYEDKGTGGGRKLCIQKKDEMLHSPDEADALACGIELLRRKGINATIITSIKIDTQKSLDRVLEENDFDVSTESYSDPLLDQLNESFTF